MIKFDRDNFELRRSNSPACGVPYDPDSLLTGAEVEAGLTYMDKRHWASEVERNAAVAGAFLPQVIPELAPRVLSADHEELVEVLALLNVISPDSEETGYGDSVVAWLKGL